MVCKRCGRERPCLHGAEGGRTIALYELTVVKLNGGIELRYTDQTPRLGGNVIIDGRNAQVVSRHLDVVSANAIERFVCQVTTTLAGSSQSWTYRDGPGE